MFKVMIVDDEIYVVALIQKLVNWEKYNMEVVATANDGITALHFVEEIKPDLIIVDVRMPGYDGIEFMDKIREFNKKVRFIVVSGHKQFDYAKGAMRNNVEDYLLKPINKEELEKVIGRVCKGLAEDRQNENRLRKIEEELDSSKLKIKKSFLESILRNEYEEDTFDLIQINQRYMTKFEQGHFRMAALILDGTNTLEEGQANCLMLREVQKELRNSLREVCFEILECMQNQIVFFLLNYPGEKEESIKDCMLMQLEKSRHQIEKFENLRLCICEGGAKPELSAIGESADEMHVSILIRTSLENKQIITSSCVADVDCPLPDTLDIHTIKFEETLQSLDMNKISMSIRSMFSKAFYVAEDNPLALYKLFMAFVGKIYAYFSNIGIYTETEKQIWLKYRAKFIQAPVSSEYPRILIRDIKTLIEKNQLSEQNKITPAIRIAKSYIAEHYREDISLSGVADIVNLSPVYLSRLFKKEEGINFLDYLNQYRIDIAKRMLKEEIKYSVMDIAEESGFSNTKYFSRIFKKCVGITPSEYRSRHLGKGRG